MKKSKAIADTSVLLRYNLIPFLCSFYIITFSQPSFTEIWAYPYNANYSALSLKADQQARPYVYVASNEAGLIILSTEGELVGQIPADELGLQVMNVTQDGQILYLALGSHFNDGPAGVGAVDVSDPARPIILDIWIYETPETSNGMGILVTENGYLYAGAMGLGLLIIDNSDPENLQLVSFLPLDINFPHPNPANHNLYNARGMDVVDNLLYLTYDAGGLRIIDVSDPENPTQIGAYANPVTFDPINLPRAYNNVKVIDAVAYVAVDYCGLEALDVSDPTNIRLLDHYNPVNCPAGSWFNAIVHTNEIAYNASCNQLFVTGGRSELLAFDISDPTDLILNGSFGDIQNTMATWGVDFSNNSVYLSYLIIPIYIPIIHPFDAKWSGVKRIEVSQECTTNTLNFDAGQDEVDIFPNPGFGSYTINLNDFKRFQRLQIFDHYGALIKSEQINNKETVDVKLSAPAGLYYFRLAGERQVTTKKIIKLQ